MQPHEENWGPFDPREFTAAEWGVINEALRARAEHLRAISRSRKLHHSPATRAQMAEAADRSQELAHRAIGAKIFCRGERG